MRRRQDIQNRIYELNGLLESGKISFREFEKEYISISKQAGIAKESVEESLKRLKSVYSQITKKHQEPPFKSLLEEFEKKYKELIESYSCKNAESFLKTVLLPRLEQSFKKIFQTLKAEFEKGYTLESSVEIAQNYPEQAAARVKFLNSLDEEFSEFNFHCLDDASQIFSHTEFPFKKEFQFFSLVYPDLLGYLNLHVNFLILNIFIYHRSSELAKNLEDEVICTCNIVEILFSSSGKKEDLKNFEDSDLDLKERLLGHAFNLFYECSSALFLFHKRKSFFMDLIAEAQDALSIHSSLPKIIELINSESNYKWYASLNRKNYTEIEVELERIPIERLKLARLEYFSPMYQSTALNGVVKEHMAKVHANSKALSAFAKNSKNMEPREVCSKNTKFSNKKKFWNSILEFHLSFKYNSYRLLSSPYMLYFGLQRDSAEFQTDVLNSGKKSGIQAKAEEFFKLLNTNFSTIQKFLRELSEEQLNYIIPDKNKKWTFACTVGYLFQTVAMYAYLFSGKEFNWNLNHKRLILGLALRALESIEEAMSLFSRSTYKLKNNINTMEFQTILFQEAMWIDISNSMTKKVLSFILVGAEQVQRNGKVVFTGGRYEMNSVLLSYFNMMKSQIKRLMINLDIEFKQQQVKQSEKERELSEKEQNWLSAYEELMAESEEHIKRTQKIKEQKNEERRKLREARISKAFKSRQASSTVTTSSKSLNTTSLEDQVISSILELRRNGKFSEAVRVAEEAISATPTHKNNRLKILSIIQLAYDKYDHAMRLSDALSDVLTVRMSDLRRIKYLKQRIASIPQLLEESLTYLEAAKNDYIFIREHNLLNASIDGFFIEENFQRILLELKEDINNLFKDFNQTSVMLREIHNEFKKSPRYKQGNLQSPSEYSTLRKFIYSERDEVHKKLPKLQSLELGFSEAKEIFNQRPDFIRSRFFVQITDSQGNFISDSFRKRNPKMFTFDDIALGTSKMKSFVPIQIPQSNCSKSWLDLLKVKLCKNHVATKEKAHQK